jgi:hypothetical protein
MWKLVSKGTLLVTFGNDTVTWSEDITDFETLGDVSMKDLGMSIPYYGIQSEYTNEPIHEFSQKILDEDDTSGLGEQK